MNQQEEHSDHQQPTKTNARWERFFATEHLEANLKHRAVRGGMITLLQQVISKLLMVAVLAVLARLLSPQEYGLIAMITAVTGFMLIFKDLGLSMATIQKDTITHEQVSFLFWVNVAVSVLVMGIIMALAPVLVWFYQRPELTPLTLFMATGFVFSGLCVQHEALMKRQMCFGQLAVITIVMTVGSSGAAVWAAWLGAGVWALTIMPVVSSLINMVMLWIICPWRPGWPQKTPGVRSMLMFGGNFSAFHIVNYFARNMDNVLIGRFWGPESLGLYSKAYSLLLLPLRQINLPMTATAIPTLSRLQHDPERFRRYFLKAFSLVAFLTMPLVAYLIVMAQDVILLILGSKWIDAGPIFMILGISALIQPMVNATGWLYLATGQANRMLHWAFFSSSAIVLSFIIGLPHGIKGVAIAYTICTWLIVLPNLWHASRQSPVSLVDMLNAIGRTAISTLITAAALIGFKMALTQVADGVSGLIIGLIITIVVFFVSNCLMARSITPITELSALLRSLKAGND